MTFDLEFGHDVRCGRGGGVLEGREGKAGDGDMRRTNKRERGRMTLLLILLLPISWMLAWSADGGMQKILLLKYQNRRKREPRTRERERENGTAKSTSACEL